MKYPLNLSRSMRRTLAILATTSCLTSCYALTAWAQEPAREAAFEVLPHDGGSFVFATDSVLTLHRGGSADMLTTYRATVLNELVLSAIGSQTRNYLADSQTLEVVEAYTLKQDGRKVFVDPESIMTRDAASSETLMYQLTLKSKTIIFPDLAVGDTIVLKTRLEMKRDPVTPGHFAFTQLFRRDLPYAESKMRIVAPKELGLKVGVYGRQLEQQTLEDERTISTLITYRPAPRSMREPGETSAFDHDPRILMSTFKDNQEQGTVLAAATAARLPRTPTPAVMALADEITRGIQSKRGQAEAIDRWVKDNIRYIALFADVSEGLLPHDADRILKNRYGDCKDHVELMSALLAAKGIASESVRIHLGDVYTMPEIASPAYQNHRIIYLPDFGIYDDPTAAHVAFGVLAPGDYDKPVIRMSDRGAQVDRTPPMRAEDHATISRTKINVAADRSLTGETTEVGTGIFVMKLQAAATRILQDGTARSAEAQLRTNGTPGTGRFEITSLVSTTAAFTLKGAFTLGYKINTAPDALPAIPTGLATDRPGNFFFGPRYAGRKQPFMCYAGRQVQEIDITFAEGLPLPDAIKSGRIDTKVFSYTADYRLEGRTLKIKREFVSRVAGQVCEPDVEAAIADPLKAVEASLAVRLHFTPGAPSATVPPAPSTNTTDRSTQPNRGGFLLPG